MILIQRMEDSPGTRFTPRLAWTALQSKGPWGLLRAVGQDAACLGKEPTQEAHLLCSQPQASEQASWGVGWRPSGNWELARCCWQIYWGVLLLLLGAWTPAFLHPPLHRVPQSHGSLRWAFLGQILPASAVGSAGVASGHQGRWQQLRHLGSGHSCPLLEQKQQMVSS